MADRTRETKPTALNVNAQHHAAYLAQEDQTPAHSPLYSLQQPGNLHMHTNEAFLSTHIQALHCLCEIAAAF